MQPLLIISLWEDNMKFKESETIRSFLAIELDESLVPKILDVQKEFKKTNANIKYVNSKNMHFTLKFFGNICIC